MPPNNQNGGGRKGGPWSQGPSGGQRNQPNLEELLKRGQDKFRQAIPGGSGVPDLFIFLAVVVLEAVIAFLWLHLSGKPR
jgi:modulator of FtsH protease HflK